MEPLPSVDLLSRPGCHLCDEAQAFLTALAGQHRFTVNRVDISSDPEIEGRYGEHIPVVLYAGRELARAPIDEDRLRSNIERAFRR
jgi:hypothetical protein